MMRLYIKIFFLVTFMIMSNQPFIFGETLNANYVADANITAMIASNPELIEEQLCIAMNRLLNNPATLTIEIEHKSEAETSLGIFQKVLVKTSGGNVENLVLNTADVEFIGVQINTKKLFEEQKIEPVKIEDIIMDVVILEKDLNNFIKVKSKSIKVDRPKIELKKDRMELSGSTKYGILRADFAASGKLSVKNKNEVWFHSSKIEINRMTMPRSFVGMIIKKINPVLNLKSFPFKLELKSINTMPGQIEFTSKR